MPNNPNTLFVVFWREHAVWSQAQFGADQERGPIGPLKHLEKEAREAQQTWGKPSLFEHHEEIADCFMLVLDAARRSGMTPTVLLQEAFKKLNKNRLREWPKNDPTSDEPVHHEGHTIGGQHTPADDRTILLEKLYVAVKLMRNTAIVDNDFLKMRDKVDGLVEQLQERS